VGLRTFRLTLAYDGTAYAGWQVQPDVATVQGVLEHAAERLNGEPTSILGAGRTDAGVHARGQVARFLTGRDLGAAQVPRALNAFLPEDVVVQRADEVGADFHPIRDARRKHYRYTWRVAACDDPFDRRFVLRVAPPLDVAAMRVAAAHMTGRHDFSAFEKAGSPRDSTVRTLHRLDLTQEGDYIRLNLVANGFLYGMARNLAGTVLRVGQSRLDPEALPGRLDQREIAGPSLPAHGLCLVRVAYDDTEWRTG